MKPIGIYTHAKNTYVILHECIKCDKRMRSKTILKDKNASDDFDLIVELSENEIKEKG